MNTSFSSQTLTEKLSKLNNSQQSIESLSHWCVFHRKKAKQIVETWEKLFISSPKEQQVSFLYLANDILQNSRRKGSEFVNEFWKVLPGTLKSVCENDDEQGTTVVMRLVDIWDERKVFGSRGKGLKNDILGKTPGLDKNENSSNALKVVRKDAHSIRIKLSVGGKPEKIVTAYQSVLDEHFNEDIALNKCKAAVSHMGRIEKDVDATCTQGIRKGSQLLDEIHEQQTILNKSIEQLQNIEATRAVLIVQLKEALQEEESKQELIHTQLRVAQVENEHAASMKQRLLSATVDVGPDRIPSPAPITTAAAQAEAESFTESSTPSLQLSSTPLSQPSQSLSSFLNSFNVATPQHLQPVPPIANSISSPPPRPLQPVGAVNNLGTAPQPPQPSPSFLNTFSTASSQSFQPVTSPADSLSTEEQNKKAAAAVAAKLTASTSSAQMLASVLSSLVAEEAASMNGGLSSAVLTGSPPLFPAGKRAKLEKPMSVSDMGNNYFGQMQQQQPLGSVPLTMPHVSATSSQPVSQANHHPPPYPPPLPPMPRPTTQQFVQSGGVMVGGTPYSFIGNAMPPPPPTSHTSMGLARPTAPQVPPPPPPPLPQQQHQQQQQQQQMQHPHQQQQQNPANTGFFQPSGMGFFGQLQKAPPVPTAQGSVASQGSSA